MIDKSGRNPIKTTKVVAHASVYAKLLKHRTVLCDDILLKKNEIQWTVTTFTYTINTFTYTINTGSFGCICINLSSCILELVWILV